MKLHLIRHMETVTEINIEELCEITLTRMYGTSEVGQLTSHERHKAYEGIKGRLLQTARSLDDYEQKLKQTTRYLEI